MEHERVNVLGVGVSVINQDRARELLFAALREGQRGYVTVTGVHGVSEAQTDETLRAIFNDALMVTPDGMPMVWMGRAQGHPTIERVYGPDLMLNLCGNSVAQGHKHFLFGGAPGVADALRDNLIGRFPGLRVVGTFSPPYRRMNEKELGDLQQMVQASQPDFFWVGLSTPKQERFMAQHLQILPGAKIFIGVGAAFDLLTGRVRQAPKSLQNAGLEWLFRLTQEPKRLWKRYLVNNPLFVIRAGGQLLGLRNYLPQERSDAP